MRRFLPFAIIVIVTAAVYSGVWSGGFLRDDFPVITENRWITSPAYIPEIFSSTLWGFYQGDFITGTSNYYRPMMHLLLMASYNFFGTEPAGYHGVNLLFHILNSFLVFLIARAFLKTASPAREESGSAFFPLGAALLFALHPASAEAVVWVGAIGELSFTFFLMASFYLFLLNGQGRGAAFYIVSLFIYVVALFSKETATVLSPIFVLYELSAGRPLVQAIKRGAPYLAAAALFVLLRSSIVGALSIQHSMGGFQYLLSVVTLSAQYAGKLLFPFGIKLYYPFSPPGSFADIISYELLLLFFAVAAAAFWLVRSPSRKTVVFFLLWISMALSPPILMVKYIQGEWVFAARYLYFPIAGLLVLAAIGLKGLAGQRPVKALWTAPLIVLLVLFAVETVRISKFWADEFSFWKKAAEDAPMSPTTHASLGVSYAEKKMYREAIREYELALGIAPDSANIYSNLGIIYYNLRDLDRAIESFGKAAALSTNESSSAGLNTRIGLIYFEKGLPDKAIFHLEQAVTSGLADGNVHNVLGIAYARTGQSDKAYRAFSEAVRLDPQNARARENLERVSAEVGRARH